MGAPDPRRCGPNCHTCGGEFGVEFHDPVFGRAGFCPRCGAEL